MAYAPPSITAAGLSVPQFPDIQNLLLTAYTSIYPQNSFLGPSSSDFQWINAIALLVNDAMSLATLIYNNRGPGTAVGSALDSIIKLNGMARVGATASTVQLSLGGTPFAVITNGVARDQQGNLWSLPPSITLNNAGSASVSATCQTTGAISAGANTVNIIQTLQPGWTSVTNPQPASPGQAVETDSHVRARQAISVALPSNTLLEGTIAAIAQTPGVTRFNVQENTTNATNALGIPGHSICAVVEGGSEQSIAQTIFENKGIGCGTFGSPTGSTAVTINIPVPGSSNGLVIPISYALPVETPIFVTVTLNPLSGFTTSMATQVQTAIVAYLNSLQIGETVSISALSATAMSQNANLAQPNFSVTAITAGTSANPTGTTDIVLSFNAAPQGITANVIVNT